MRTFTALALVAMLIMFSGCDQDSSLTQPESDALVFEPLLDLTVPPDGGDCPNVWWLSEETLDDGITVSWRSGHGGFDYGIGTSYFADVNVVVEGADWELSDQTGERPRKNNAFTPRGRDPTEGVLESSDPPFTVNMDPMHQGDEDIDGDGINEWEGKIGNGHFFVVIDVVGINKPIKLGTNVHLEDPDGEFDSRCPTG